MYYSQFWIFIILGAALLAEFFAGRHRKLYSGNDYLVNGLCILLGVTVRPLLALSVAVLIMQLLPMRKDALSDWSLLPSIVVIILTAEFCNYWVHRWSHTKRTSRYLGWIWPLHRTHHTAKYMNVLLHFRLNLFWGLVSPLAWVHALAFYLGLGAAAGVSIMCFAIWGIATHCNFRWDDTVRSNRVVGPLFRGMEHIFVSPGLHHTHHGYGKDGKHYKNFGLFLSVFDWMFGSLHIPEGRPKAYGLAERRPHWAEEVFYPLYQARFFRRTSVKKEVFVESNR